MRITVQHRVTLIMLVLMLLMNTFNTYSQGVRLDLISIEPEEGLFIKYNIFGSLSNIDNLKIRFYHDLSNLENHIEETIVYYDQFEQIIPFPDAIDNSSQINVRLNVTYANGSSYRSNIHSAIFLESIESLSEACDYAINAKWSNYAIYPPLFDGPQLPPIFNEVQVFMYEYDGTCHIDNSQPIFTIPQQPLGDSEEVIDLSSANINPGDGRYCFRVASINTETDIESYSNIIENIEIEQLAEPSQPQIISIDVNNNEAIEVNVEVDNYGFSLFEYSLERSNDPDGIFEPINHISHGASEIIFFDGDIPDFENNPWYYKVVADKRDCPMQSPPSSLIVSSIYVKPIVEFETGQDNLVYIEFIWEHLDPDGGYEYSLIEELHQDQERVIYSSTNQQDAHTETIDLTQLAADVKFFVRATHRSLGYPIHSNHFIFSPEWLIPPPNAFRPGSTIEANQKFTPEFYWEVTGYSLSIYDRNGLRVFQTSSLGEGEGWDGIIQTTGQPAPEGAYIYEISFDQADKPTRGVVYLVR